MTDKDRIEHLEYIIKSIDDALCNYCNDASDPYEPVASWNDGERRNFKSLCDAYNLWYSSDADIGEISMKYYDKYSRYKTALLDIADGRHQTLEHAVKAAKKEFEE